MRTRRTKILAAIAATSMAVTALPMATGSVVQAVGPTVFINEIHYDNDGGDVGEAFEIAGPAGTDLGGWSVELYNGSNGSQYNSIALSGLLPDQQAGFGTTFVALPANGLQNGSPDGLALLDSANAVVEFLSYEGSFTAMDGPAAGLTSVDIGVSEPGTTPVGSSLQLAGTGSMGGDFTWTAAQPNTFGAVNTDQTFEGGEPAAPIVVINEIDYDQPGTDTAEFVELYNAGSVDADLTGWSLELVNGSNNSIYGDIALATTLAPGDFFVVCANAATVANCDLDASPDTNFLQNGEPDAIGLRDGADVLVDAISYEGNVPGYVEGSGAAGDSGGDADVSLSRCPDGADTDDNSVDVAPGRPVTPGAANDCTDEPVGPAVGDLVISEVMQNPAAVGDDVGEYFEITNVSGADADIDGWVLTDDGTNIHTIDNGGPLVVPAGARIVLGVVADAAVNGGVPVDYAYGSFALANGDDEIILTDPSGTEFDRVAWDGGPVWPDPTGASMSLDPSVTDITANDDGGNWCESTTQYGAGDLGTPGAVNDGCDIAPLPCPGAIAIAAVQGTGDATPLAGQEVTVRGIVTTDDGGELVIQEAFGGPRSGIVVFSSGNTASVGDEVCVTGIASERFDLTQIGGNSNPSATVDVLSSGNAVPTPAVVSTATIATGSPDAEQWESVLIRVEAVTVVDADLGNGEFSIDDGTGAVRVDDKYFRFVPSPAQTLDFVQGPLAFSFGDYKVVPRSADDIGVTIVPEVCGDPATFIHDIQGSGTVTAMQGATASIEGVVVGDFQDTVGANGDLNGFYVQEEDAQVDGNPETSEGIFVFQGSNPTVDVAVGDLVRVAGTVTEFETTTSGVTVSETQIGASSVLLCEGTAPTPTPTNVDLPIDSLDRWEWYEGMLLGFEQTLTIVEYFNYDRFGEVVLADDRLFQPTAVFAPGTPEAAALADDNDRSKITLDDGQTASNPDFVRHPDGSEFTLDNRFRGGDQLDGVTGVLGESFGLYRIQPTAGATYIAANPRVGPEDVGGDVTVASFNVLNYFSTLDGNGSICGPGVDQGCRGADDENERIRQLDKIVAAIDEIDADVVGIIEVENTTGVEAMADIVGGLNATLGAGTYDYIDTGTVGNDAIKVGFIYQPGAVTPLGDFAVLDDPAFVAPFGEERNRAALAQTFQDNGTGGVFTVAVNHLKSKGSGCGVGDDDPEAGSCNLTRTVAAQVLADWLATDPTGSGDPDVMIVGDLNSYDREDPIDVLEAAGYADLLDVYQGELAYSYLFSGELGYLDYAMANASLASQVTGATAWHSNSDEPDILDYDTSFKSDTQIALYDDGPYRASDHDAVIVGLDVCEAVAPDLEVQLSRTVLWPPNGKYRDVEATIIVSDNFDSDPEVRLVSAVSDEPDNGDDDGNTVDDIVVLDDDSFLIRAERSGSGDGRTYTITYEAEDDCGNITTATATVEVPLNRSGRNTGNTPS